jgi:hypothetical protein
MLACGLIAASPLSVELPTPPNIAEAAEKSLMWTYPRTENHKINAQ